LPFFPLWTQGPTPEPSPSRRPGSPQENSLRERKEIENEGPLSPGTSFSRLRRELEQCKQDIQNLPFPHSENQSQTLYPLGSGGIGFINTSLTNLEVRNLKRELRSLLEDPHGLQINLTNSLAHRFTHGLNYCPF
jgi:hypothetical protein